MSKAMSENNTPKPEHTPGPWYHNKASVYIKREFDNDLWVAECRTYEDATLIARAPEMATEITSLREENRLLRDRIDFLMDEGYNEARKADFDQRLP